MLIVFSGLPGVGKTTLSKIISNKLGAIYLRIDTIEQALKNSSLKLSDVQDAGYRAAYGIAEDNLRAGGIVVSDSVNSVGEARQGWVEVAKEADVKVIEIEVVCSNKNEHKKRIEMRISDLENHILPTWQEVLELEYELCSKESIIVDTANKEIEACIEEIMNGLKR